MLLYTRHRDNEDVGSSLAGPLRPVFGGLSSQNRAQLSRRANLQFASFNFQFATPLCNATHVPSLTGLLSPYSWRSLIPEPGSTCKTSPFAICIFQFAIPLCRRHTCPHCSF